MIVNGKQSVKVQINRRIGWKYLSVTKGSGYTAADSVAASYQENDIFPNMKSNESVGTTKCFDSRSIGHGILEQVGSPPAHIIEETEFDSKLKSVTNTDWRHTIISGLKKKMPNSR
jgi:hypothetical protein